MHIPSTPRSPPSLHLPSRHIPGLQRVSRATGQVLPAANRERGTTGADAGRGRGRTSGAVPRALLSGHRADRFAGARSAQVAPVDDEAHAPVRADEREVGMAPGTQGRAARGRGAGAHGPMEAHRDEPRFAPHARAAACRAGDRHGRRAARGGLSRYRGAFFFNG